MTSYKKTSFWKIFFASLLAIVISGVLFWVILFGVVGASFQPKEFKVEEKTILHITMDESFAETTSNEFNPNTFEIDKTIGLNDALIALESAAKDDRIKGIFLDINGAPMGFATLHEFRDALNKFKESGKFILAYNSGELVTQKALLLSSIADEYYIFPTSTVELFGFGAELMYFKNMLEKLSIDMQVIRGSGNDFKSAVEPFFLDKMSDSSRVQTARLLEVLWAEYRNELGKSRNIKPEMIDSIANNALVRRGLHALDFKLVDGLKYRDEVLEMLKEKSNTAKDKELNFMAFAKYANEKARTKKTLDESKSPQIAVLFAEGDITTDGDGIASNELVEDIREIRKNKKIKALVFRVNSPGGSALASDEIWRELTLLAQSKKLIVSMGDVAASGGYYISAPAHRIFAQPSTITGSIGVFGVIPYTGAMFEEKLGITFDRVQTNKHSVMTLNKKLSDEEMSFVQEEVDAIYEDFIGIVAKGRKLKKDAVKKIAKGRVWIGADAIKIGLVDELGGLKDAMNYTAKTLGIESPTFDYYPKTKEGKFDQLLMSLAEEEVKSIKSPLSAEVKTILTHLKTISQMKGVQARLPYILNIQ